MVKLDNQRKGVVKIFAEDTPEPLKDSVTDEKGSFSFLVPNGVYQITAWQNKNVGYSSKISVNSANITKDQEIVLNLGAEVSGTIVDSGGKPLENISLYFTTNPTFGGRVIIRVSSRSYYQ